MQTHRCKDVLGSHARQRSIAALSGLNRVLPGCLPAARSQSVDPFPLLGHPEVKVGQLTGPRSADQLQLDP